jgi:DNA-binding NarL/FixJ family response regulator
LIRILVADDHPLIRKGIENALADVADIDVAGEASTGDEVLANLKGGTFDIVLLDISMPGPDGLELIGRIRSLYPQVKIIVVTMHPEERYGIRAIKAGASGYVRKEMASTMLVDAISQVQSGGRFLTPRLVELMAGVLADERRMAPHELLSDREFQVLRLLVNGVSQRDVAEQLSISPKTVSTYRARILEKLSLATTPELVRYAIEHDLVE